MADTSAVIPPPPPGFTLDSIPPPPAGFVMDGAEPKPQGVPRARGKSMPANAGVANFAASMVGLPMDTVQNAINLVRATQGGIAGAIGADSSWMPPMMQNIPGGSENVRNMLRSTGLPGVSPDNPNPASKGDTMQYDFVSRGGFIPGGALPAAGSMIGENIGGPVGGIIGGMAPAAIGQAISSIPRTKLDANQQLLAGENVSMTPGQIRGGSLRRAEDAATSIPVLGDAIKSAQRRGIESFNAAAINRSLSPIGEMLPKGVIGEKAIEYARSKLGDAYEGLLPNLKGDLNAVPGAGALPAQAGQAAPMSFRQELDTIKSMGQSLPPGARRDLNSIIKNEVLDKFTPSGIASGETLKNIESELNNLAKGFRQSDSYGTRQLGTAVQEIQASMRRMINDVNPAYQGELAKINEGYANFKKVQAAAANIGAQEGIFTPSQLRRSVRAGDTTKDKRAFSEGDALMQDLADAGKGVLSQTVPDSGTPYRTAVKNAIAHPFVSGMYAIPITVGAAAYSPIGQQTIQNLMTKGGQSRTLDLQELIQQALMSNQQK